MTSTAHALNPSWKRDRTGGRARALVARTSRLGTGGVLALAALVSFAPLLALAALSIQTGGDSIRRQVDDRLASSAALSARFVGAQMKGAQDVTSAYAAGPALVGAVVAGRSPETAAVVGSRLAQLHAAVNGSKAAFLATPGGRLTDIQPPDPTVVGKDFSGRDWYRGVTGRLTAYVSEAYVSAYIGHPLAVAVAAPVFADAAGTSLVAIMVVIYPVESIQAFTEGYLQSSGLALTVVDQRGHLVAGPGLRSQMTPSGRGALVSSSMTMRPGIQESTSGGRQVLEAYSAIPALGWSLLAQADKAAVLVGATDLQRNVLLTTVALALIMIAGLGVTGVSMGQRRRTDLRMSEAVQQRQQLLDGLPVGVLVVGKDGRPQYANHMSAALLGRAASPDVPPGEVPEAYRVFIAGTDEPYPTDRIPVARALAGESLRVDDMEVEREDGRVALECWANPIYDHAGHAVGAVAAFLDVSARKQAQRDLLQLNTELDGRVTARTTELAASNEELEAFTYSVSHDLRAPLRAMAGFATKLQQKIATQDEPELARYAERIAVNAKKMGELIDQLLTFSRLNRQDLNKSSFSPTQAVERALDDLSDDIAQSHAEITVTDMPLAVGDPGLVQEVFANLLSNALKYSGKRARPTIVVGAIPRAGAATVFFVRDNGAGFDMRFKDKLFGVFQRLHGGDEYDGIGVGLAIVKRIVTRHGGEVFAEGAVDGGATFSFTLGGP